MIPEALAQDTLNAYLRKLTPASQLELIEGMNGISAAWKQASNDLEKYILLEERTRLLKKIMPGRQVENWVGTITEMGVTHYGDAFLVVELNGFSSEPARPPPTGEEEGEKEQNALEKPKPGFMFKTQHTRLTDLDDRTLIAAGSPLFKLISVFVVGDNILFNVEGVSDMKTFIKEESGELDTRLLHPSLISRFIYLEKINIPDVSSSTSISTASLPSTPKDTPDTTFEDGKGKKPVRSRVVFLPKLNLHLFREYRLSSYDWDYAPFMSQWQRHSRTFWQNNPSQDYLSGKYSKGGRVTVTMTLTNKGRVIETAVETAGSISEMMKKSALRAVKTFELPGFPINFRQPLLKASFFFEYPPMFNWFYGIDSKALDEDHGDKGSRKDEEIDKAAALIDLRLQKKLKLKKTREEYHLKLKDRIETKFQVFQPFSPKEQMLIRLDVASSVQQTRWEILEDSSSPAFRLAVVNALESSRIPPVPRLIQEANVYPVLLEITP